MDRKPYMGSPITPSLLTLCAWPWKVKVTVTWILSVTLVGVSECYQSLTAHQHQKGHTVPKCVWYTYICQQFLSPQCGHTREFVGRRGFRLSQRSFLFWLFLYCCLYSPQACLMRPCLNGGWCQTEQGKKDGSYVCKCRYGYTGDRCEYSTYFAHELRHACAIIGDELYNPSKLVG